MSYANNNVISLYGGDVEQKPTFNSTQVANITAAVKSIATMHLTVLLRSMFANIDDMLFETSLSGDGNDMSNEEVHSLRMKYKHIELHFIKRFEAMFSQSLLLSPLQPEDTSRMRSLQSFLSSNDDELEASIMLTHFVAKAHKINQGKLDVMQSGFDTIMNSVLIKKGAVAGWSKNPVAPSIISSAFKSSASHLDNEIIQMSILFDHFDQNVMQELGGMYDQIIALFKKVGAIS